MQVSRRGVVEGFYGRPYTPDQRKKLVEFLGKWKLDTFLCSPKEQQNQRIHWKDPFSVEFLIKYRKLARFGKKQGVTVGTSISPGLTVEFSNEDDINSQFYKIQQLSSVGCRLMGIFFDSVPPTLESENDKKNFEDVASAHVYFVNTLYQRAKESGVVMEFLISPAQYYGIGNEEYLSTFGPALNPELKIIWTGRQICSPMLTYSDAQIFEKNTKHKPFYWDNYPVNDLAMSNELHIGPFRNRDAAMLTNMEGYVANPMALFEASLIPLRTMADFFNDPYSYDPDVSWSNAVYASFPNQAERKAFHHFGRTVQDSCLNYAAAPDVWHLLQTAARAWRTDDFDSAVKILADLAKEIKENAEVLLKPKFSNKRLQKEIRPWVKKYQLCALGIDTMAQVLECNPYFQDKALNKKNIVRLTRSLNKVHKNFYQVCGFELEMLMKELIEEIVWAVKNQ